ncbi:MAG TPA: heavy metal-responsive transcriptional regulator [Pyrinomonadaceae bacterium]|nr:heavy metal-responsive transcriptional regulator [Pyrinomonadaceae bacterium]
MRNAHRHAAAGEGTKGVRVLRIGEVARRSGVGVEALRFYERRGLLGRPARTESNYRVYDESVLERLDFIRRAQAVGFTLDEMGEILAESAGGRSPCLHVRELARRKLEEPDARLAELRRHRADLARTLAEWDERGEEEGRVCGLIEHSTLGTHAEHAGVRGVRKAGKGVRK